MIRNTLISLLSSLLISSLTIAWVYANPAGDAATVMWLVTSPIDAGAADRAPTDSAAAIDGKDAAIGWSGPTVIFTTERVPGALCTCAIDNRDGKDIWAGMTLESQCGNPQTRKYKCVVEQWLGGFQNIFREIMRYIVYLTMLLGVLAVVWVGILWTWGSDSEEHTKKAKWWVMNILIGFVILATFSSILRFLAPWVFA